MFNLGIFADCIKTFFGEICDTCDGAAIYSLLALIIRIFTGALGIIAIIGIVITGISFLTSSGDPSKHNKARSRLINLGIGIVVYIVLFFLAEFLVPGGIINHPVSSSEPASCPEVSYTDTTITRPENPGNASGQSPDNPNTSPDDPSDNPSDDPGGNPNVSEAADRTSLKGQAPEIRQSAGYHNGKKYTFLEIKNAIPYIYYRDGTVKEILNHIKSKNSNILVLANASLDMGDIISGGKVAYIWNNDRRKYESFVVDEKGNVGFAYKGAIGSTLITESASYKDAITEEEIKGRKIFSAVQGFGSFYPNDKFTFGVNSKGETLSGKVLASSRQRQILCFKEDGSFVLLTNVNSGNAGGWNRKDMVKIINKHDCKSAYNFDGGGSTELAYRSSTNNDFKRVHTDKNRGMRGFLVFTSDNNPPYARKEFTK